jgi:hypothetical protein
MAMPVKIKLGLSLITIMVGHDRIQYVVAFLGLFMIFAMWLFPEIKRDEKSDADRRDTAPR